MSSPYQPSDAMRKALAIVSATIQRDHSLARKFVGELDAAEARFALSVTAEYLSQAIHRLALTGEDTAEDIWRSYCLLSEQAIQRAADRSAAG